MSSAVINFSGHALSAEAESILKSNYGEIINLEPYDFDFGKEVEPQIEQIISNIPCKLDGTISLTVIPPGQSTLSILVVSYLHGLTGHFPKLCYLEIDESGLYLPKTEYEINTQNIRTAGRRFRKILFNRS